MSDTNAQPTVLLRHTVAGEIHHDWMIARAGEDRLWTARLQPHSSQWRSSGTFELTVLPPHRRAYLTYEGPISGGRGEVVRVDEGDVNATVWTDQRICLDVQMAGFSGQVQLVHLEADQWEARIAK